MAPEVADATSTPTIAGTRTSAAATTRACCWVPPTSLIRARRSSRTAAETRETVQMNRPSGRSTASTARERSTSAAGLNGPETLRSAVKAVTCSAERRRSSRSGGAPMYATSSSGSSNPRSSMIPTILPGTLGRRSEPDGEASASARAGDTNASPGDGRRWIPGGTGEPGEPSRAYTSTGRPKKLVGRDQRSVADLRSGSTRCRAIPLRRAARSSYRARAVGRLRACRTSAPAIAKPAAIRARRPRSAAPPTVLRRNPTQRVPSQRLTLMLRPRRSGRRGAGCVDRPERRRPRRG
ncbi:hypothetical protein HRbin12_01497 [bacterium HR12]|nr:hypothetical protein HRbin12_01497 [bacterium HR12]